MSTEIFKKQGQLFETSAEEAVSQGATTPAGAKAAGAGPDSAKMMGTPAQKAADSRPTLQQSQRYQKKVAPDPSATQAAAEKVDRLKALGGIESQLEAKIKQRIEQTTTQELQQQAVNDQYVQQAVEQQKHEGLTAALNELAMAETPEAWQAAFIKAKGFDPKLTKDSVGDYFMGAEGHMSTALKAAMPETMTVGDALGAEVNTLAADLGMTPEELGVLNMEALEAKIQEIENQEFNQIQELEAELPGAVGARREQIIRELKNLGQAGVTGIEASYDRIQQDIEEARTVDIAGQEFSLQSILEDDELSDYILSATTDTNVMNDLVQNAPGLADWIVQNQEALQSMQEEQTAQAQQFETVQSQIKDTVAGKEELADALIGERPEYMTEGQWTEYNQQLQDTGAWQAADENADVALAFKTNPDLVPMLKELDKDSIIGLTELDKELKNDTGALNEWLGLGEGEFPTDPETLNKYREIKDGLAAVRGSKGGAQIYNELAAYPNSLSSQQLQKLAAAPENWDQVKSALNAQAEFDDMSFGDMVDTVFSGMSVNEVNARLNSLKKYAMMGHAQSLSEYQKLKQLVGDNGLDRMDVEKLKGQVEKGLSLEDALEGRLTNPAERFKNINKPVEGVDAGTHRAVEALQDDRLTDNEIRELDELGVLDKLMDIGEFSDKYGSAITTYKKSKGGRQYKKDYTQTQEAITNTLDMPELSDAIFKDKEYNIKRPSDYKKIQRMKQLLSTEFKSSKSQAQKAAYARALRAIDKSIKAYDQRQFDKSAQELPSDMDLITGGRRPKS